MGYEAHCPGNPNAVFNPAGTFFPGVVVSLAKEAMAQIDGALKIGNPISSLGKEPGVSFGAAIQLGIPRSRPMKENVLSQAFRFDSIASALAFRARAVGGVCGFARPIPEP